MMSLIKTIISTLNPNIYKGLVLKSYKQTISYLFLIILFFSFFTFLIFIPQIIGFYKNVNSNLDNISILDLEFNAQTNGEVILLSNPKIVIDSARNSTKGEYILIGKDKIYKKGLFGYKEYSNKADIVNILKQSKFQIIIISLIILPTIFLFHYLINLIKYFFLIMFFSIIGFLVIKLTNSNIKIKQLINTSIYSLTILLLLKLGLFFNQTLKLYIPIIIYSLWYVLVLILLQDTKIEYTKTTKTKTSHSKKHIDNQSPDANQEEMAKIQKMLRDK